MCVVEYVCLLHLLPVLVGKVLLCLYVGHGHGEETGYFATRTSISLPLIQVVNKVKVILRSRSSRVTQNSKNIHLKT